MCLSTTKWQVVASSDPIIETLSAKQKKGDQVFQYKYTFELNFDEG